VGRALDYYAVLGVARNASVEQIDRAYRALARKVHPDRNAGDAERADARMKQLNLIRETLTDPLLRAAYDDRLRQEHQPPPAPSPPPPQQAAPPRAEDRWRQAAPPRYEPHPHVAPFLRTHVAQGMAAPRRRRDLAPTVAGVLVAGLVVCAVALFWPRPDPPMARRPDPPPVEETRPRREGVTIVRGDTTATRRAVRKTAKVVPVGITLDEVIAKFGPPDRVESHPAPGDVTLVYGKVRVELKDGKVVGGEP